MRWVLFVVVFISCVTKIVAQIPTPVFFTKGDSIGYASIEKNISELNKRASDTGNYDGIDSLLSERRRFLETHRFVYRMIYRQDPSFTPYQVLAHIANKDSITKISVLGEGKSRKKLPRNLFKYKHLEELELIDFKLKKLPGKLKVKRIVISNNSPSKPLRFSKNTTIVSLTIRGDEKGMLPTNYRKLEKLRSLTLARNNLSTFPPIDGCDEMRILNLNNNQIEKIDKAIVNMRNLESLSLYRNCLTEIPDFLYTMKTLRSVDLYFNEIRQVSPAISNWTNLEILYLANNEIYSLPEEIGQLINLKELYLHHNKLSNLPASIGNLTSLSTLRINRNNLFEWPASLTSLRSLTNFDFSFNQFTTLPINDLDFRNMKILSIGGNPWQPEIKFAIKSWANSLRENNTVVHE